MASSTTPQAHPWLHGSSLSQEPHHISRPISDQGTVSHRQQDNYGLPHYQEPAVKTPYKFAKWQHREPADLVPSQSPAIDLSLKTYALDSVLSSNSPLQMDGGVSLSEFKPNKSSESESTQRKEQTRTMSSPEPKFPFLTAHPIPVGVTPPRSTSSPAFFNNQNFYDDVSRAFPPSPIQSHAPPTYSLRNPNTATSNYNMETLKSPSSDTRKLHIPTSISVTPTSLFNTEWTQIQRRRTNQTELRSQIRVLRKRLREKQNTKAIAEDRFFQRVRKKEMRVQEGPSDMEDELMMHLMERYQQERDEYGPLEDDCNQLEDRLSAEEAILYRLENDFYQKWTVIPDASTSPRPSNSPLPASPISETVEEDANFSFHPTVEKYLSRQGDLDLLFERLDEILDEQENLEEQRATRAALKLSLGEEEQAWLDASEDMLRELDTKIDVMEAEVKALKEACLAQNLLDEDGEPIDMLAQEQSAFQDEEELDTKCEISEYSKYPKLIQQPLDNEDEGLDFLPDLGEQSFSLGARINKWMLDRLRSSALEVNFLARTYESSGLKKESNDIWQISVLKFWYEDGTIGFEAHTSTIKSGASGHDTPIRPSEFVKTARNSVLEIRVESSLPASGAALAIEDVKQTPS